MLRNPLFGRSGFPPVRVAVRVPRSSTKAALFHFEEQPLLLLLDKLIGGDLLGAS
jgi:hypothetical protein